MIRNIIAGITVGIANVIPGVSGGTMMVLLGVFDKVMAAIPGVLKFKMPEWKSHCIFVLQLLIGVAIGLVGFAKILEYLFVVAPTQTMYWFIGLVAFSIPVFIKQEMHGHKLNLLPFIIGVVIVVALEYLNPNDTSIVTPVIPAITASHLLLMVAMGFIGGFAMFLPGVSGSMVLLILGYYHLFKTYLAAVTTFRLDVLIPLAFMGVGILVGIVVSAKILGTALAKNKRSTLSFLLGLIVTSTIVLVLQTLDVEFDLVLVITSFIAFIFGGLIVQVLNKFVA